MILGRNFSVHRARFFF